MAQTRTAAFAAQADGGQDAPTEPVVLVRITFGGSTVYLTSRAGTYDGQVYEELLKEGLTLTMAVDRLGRVERNSGDLVISNLPDASGARFSDLLADSVMDNCAIEIDQAFVGMAAGDWLPVFRGVGLLPEQGAFDDETFTLNLLDEGQPATPDTLGRQPNRIHEVLGTMVTAAEFPRADPDAVGSMQPEIYGAVQGSPCLAVDAGAADRLAGDIDSAVTIIPLSDDWMLALFPAAGTVQIGDEQIYYTGKDFGARTIPITGANNANPVVLTSAGHGLVTGDGVVITGATGGIGDVWEALNGTWPVIVLNPNAFTVPVNSAGWGALGGTVVAMTMAVHLTGCTRGYATTTPDSHAAGAAVWEIKAEYSYLVARHGCRSVANVIVDGVLQDPSIYSIDLSGPTLIKFAAKPATIVATIVHQQPSFSTAVVSEQSPGSISTTAEQSPGSISTTSEQSPGSIATTAEHGHSTDTGSHTHTTADMCHEYQSSPSLPAQFTADQVFNFANTPASSTSVNWHIYVDVISGTWQWKNGANVVETLAQGDNFFTEASPGTQYTLKMAGAGTILIDVVERDLTRVGTGNANAATGVSTSRTGATAVAMAALTGATATQMVALAGATASSMAALAGATASSMAGLAGATATSMSALNGSTAVSTSRTANVVLSGADVEVGKVVTCDVEGYQDDGSGTYTGTPNALVTNPADQVAHIVGEQLGLDLSEYVDPVSFAAARAAFAAAGIRADWGLYQPMDSAELLERIRWSTASRLFLGQDGRFKMHVLPLGGTAAMTIDEPVDVLGPDHGGGPIKVGRTRPIYLVNHIWLLYRKSVLGGTYWALIDVEDTTSQATYRTANTLTIENDFIRDDTAAAAIAARYLAFMKDVKWRATATAFALPTLHLELCDPVGITSARMPGGWDAEPFTVERIVRTLCPPGQMGRAELTCVGV